ncbi:N-acetylneuraminate epimerase [Jannaschia rubra]|uniref:N-acetylneuraminate epimerase n=1 Tax=Jannaschia rubra TaxID=282197 RepID=A0A0M6XTG7_9RHOB|nr:N-acetylneuraminate epimerase [Jannaschia rubra]CTQ33543.1 N-acetylneuraminate epimerase precursor [Jannaschia rubra]SFG03535.1 N-acetylneuraminate epimerase [Jannaschia rubra]
MTKSIPLSAALALAVVVTATAATAEDWPDLPEGVKNGIGVRVDDTIYVGLGSAGTALYALDLNDRAAGWTERADFTGPAPSQPAATVVDGAIYVFGGSGKATEDAASPIVFDTVWRYDPDADAWSALDTTTPAGLLGAGAVTLDDGRIAVFGGYNKELFDTYLADITSIDKDTDPDAWNAVVDAYMGMEPTDYRWNDLILTYDPAANEWGDLGRDPSDPNTGAAIVATGPQTFTLVNGEIKPGLRTDAVRTVSIDGDTADWADDAPIPAPEGSDVQEGLAGAYAGATDAGLLVAGGANFQGARAAADAGRWYAHDGLDKHWAGEVFLLEDGTWSQPGELPEGLAYGASFAVDGGLLIVGGEDGERAARTDVFLIAAEDGTITVTD